MQELKNRPIKTAGYSSHTLHARRHQRQLDAERRMSSVGRPADMTGLREIIARAESETVIKQLLRDCRLGGKFASEKTQRAWQSTAQKRLAYLQSKNPVRK